MHDCTDILLLTGIHCSTSRADRHWILRRLSKYTVVFSATDPLKELHISTDQQENDSEIFFTERDYEDPNPNSPPQMWSNGFESYLWNYQQYQSNSTFLDDRLRKKLKFSRAVRSGPAPLEHLVRKENLKENREEAHERWSSMVSL